MIPILKNSNEENIGFLVDALTCVVTEERNGIYELALTYPVSGQWAAELVIDRIILAKANETSEEQLFRIYEVSKPISGVFTVLAEHISYALSNYPVTKVSLNSTTAQGAISALISNPEASKFSCVSDVTYRGKFNVEACSIRSALGGIAGSVLDVFGGEYEFNNYTIKLHSSRGADNGVSIRYGKNLTDCTMVTNMESVYTHLFPYAYGKDADGNKLLITTSERIFPLDVGKYANRVLIKDFTDMFGDDEEINEENLLPYVYGYMLDYEGAEPSINLTVSFQHLWQSPEYANLRALEKVSLCDTVHVYHEQLGVNVRAKVIKTNYDSLGEKYTSIEIGNAKSNFADTIQQQEREIQEIKNEPTEYSKITQEYTRAIEEASKTITGNKGGYVVIEPIEAPQEILIMNKQNKSTATKLWRWNLSGLGYSQNGYSGPYTTAITMDGKINADFITTGTLTANIIKAGILASVDWSSYFDLEDGELSTSNANITGGYISIGGGTYRTVINEGSIKQYLKSATNEIGGMVPLGNSSGTSYSYGIYCHNQSSVKAVTIAQRTSSGTFDSIAEFGKSAISLYNNTTIYGTLYSSGSFVSEGTGTFASRIYTNDDATNTYAGVTHYRTTTFGGSGSVSYTSSATFGVGNPNKRPSASMELRNYGASDYQARLDVMQSYGEAYIILQGFSAGSASKYLELGEQLWWGGVMNATKYQISSTEDIKDDIKEQGGVLDLIKASKIYNYKLLDIQPDDGDGEITIGSSSESSSLIPSDKLDKYKEAAQAIKDKIKEALANSESFSKLEKKTSVGFVIGRETPDEVISEDGKHVDLYSMCSITWKAVQELLSKIENIETQLNNLKEDSNEGTN